MNWASIDTGTDLSFLKNFPQPERGRLDPHLIWAAHTYLRGGSKPDSPIPVMFEAKRVNGVDQLPAAVNVTAGTGHLFAPFFTGFVRRRDLLAFATSVERFRIGVVARPTTTKQGPPPPPLRSVRLHPSPQDVVIGVIDHGIAFANKRFAVLDARGRWHSRIERIWDQQWGYPSRPGNLPPDLAQSPDANLYLANFWKAVRGYGYGRHLANVGRSRQIDFWLNQISAEDAIYRHLDYPPVQRDRAHGTHVLGIAAGTLSYGFDPRSSGPCERLVDDAARASIIAVQLPALPYKDTSGTGLCVQILDAVSYIALHAAGRKVVINLSDGAYAGPHDGNALLERALGTLFKSGNNRRAFVVAAGNQFDERVHWKQEVPPGGSAVLAWRVLPDDNSDSHLEIWPALGSDAKALQVSVTPPGQMASPLVSVGSSVKLDDTAGAHTFAALMFPADPPNSKPPQGTRAMVHVAVEATRPRSPGLNATAPHGVWKVHLENNGPQPIAFDAYIERDNPALGDAGPRRQSRFSHPQYPRALGSSVDDSGNPSPIKRMGALNNVASSQEVLVVGGYVFRSGQLAGYSASGPGRAQGAPPGVDILAVCDSSQVTRGIRGDGVRTGTTFRMDGTSVAAPQVTRWIANWMAVTKIPGPSWAAVLGPYASRNHPTLNGPADRVGGGRLAAWGAPGGPSRPVVTTAPATPSATRSGARASGRSRRSPGPSSAG